MKIMSINVNSFMGVHTKDVDGIIKSSPEYEGLWFSQRIRDFDSQNKKQVAIDGIIKIIGKEKPDIIILQEYRRNFPSAIDFTKTITGNVYRYKGPFTHQKKSIHKYGFSTAFFIKDGLKYIDESSLDNRLIFSSCNDRVYSVCTEGIIIIGVHLPLDSNTDDRDSIRETTWKEIIAYYENNTNNTILTIGDFNTYDNKGENKEAFNLKQKFVDSNAIDLWINAGNPDSIPTQKPNNSRLDYAFINNDSNKKINIKLIPEEDDDFISNEVWKLSDHRMIIVEVEDEV